jgi:hypothetical protein
VHYAATEGRYRQQQRLMQENLLLQQQCCPKQNQDPHRPRGHDPVACKLKIQRRHYASRSQICQQDIEVQPRIARRRFSFSGQLRVNEEENQRQRQNRVHPRSPQLIASSSRQVDKENPPERGRESHIRLEAELFDAAPQPVLEQNQPEQRPPYRHAQRLQLIPQQQRSNRGRCPGIDVMEVPLPPLLRHANDS